MAVQMALITPPNMAFTDVISIPSFSKIKLYPQIIGMGNNNNNANKNI